VVKSLVVKRSIIVAGHKTSVSLEDAFWKAVKEIATVHGTTVSNLVSSIDTKREQGNLSSAIRLFVLDFYRGQNQQSANRGRRTVSSSAARSPDATVSAFPQGKDPF
jgi:predicted DNA-binding ribbon-helix-helix protein